MKSSSRMIFLIWVDILYRLVIQRLIFLFSAQQAHQRILHLLAWLDNSSLGLRTLKFLHSLSFKQESVACGDLTLSYPLILAAGLVKGYGFDNEQEALSAVESGRNIIPGWRCIPILVDLVEFGSFTRYPCVGNPGVVVWRDIATHSTQNRVGLANPGVMAAAAFLAQYSKHLPAQFGLNIAVTPGVHNPEQQSLEFVECLEIFMTQGVIPTWFTLNVSCPNTDDDPLGNQTETLTRQVCSAALAYLRSQGLHTSLWIKVSPNLSPEQCCILMKVFHEVGIHAVIASNTMPAPSPIDATKQAGIGGGRLHPHALRTATLLKRACDELQADVDVIACGGILSGASYHAYLEKGIQLAQYWSALVYRGPLAAPIIRCEQNRHYGHG